MYGPYYHGWMFGGSGMLIGGLWMLLMWGVPLLVILALLKYLFARTPRRDDRDGGAGGAGGTSATTALDILKQAYARGDISREEYLRKRDDLLEK